MIRHRKSARDDAAIRWLIDQELVPLSHLSPQDIQQVKKDLPRRLRRGVTLVSCEDQDAQAVGFVHLFVYGALLNIDMLAIDTSKQRKGHGSSLLQAAEQYGRLKQCNKAKLLVDEGNQRAIRFYLRHGYHIARYISASRCYELDKLL